MDVAASSNDMWDEAKWQRYGLLAGVAFVVLGLASFLVAGSPPARDESGEKIAQYFIDNDSGIKIAAILFGLSLFFAVWWLGSLWRVISRLEPSGPRLAIIALVGMVMAGAGSSVAQALFTVPALRPDTLAGSAEFVYAFGYTIYSFVVIATAAHMMALGVLVLWKQFLPTWTGYLAFVSAIVSVVSVGAAGSEAAVFGILQLLGYLSWSLWILIASILLYRGGDTVSAAG